ncbi:chromosome segregation protein, partial [Golovinomyces cichoracearum]
MADRYEISTSTGKRPKTRKSLAYIPSQNSIHGNSTTDLGALNDKEKEYATQKKLSKARSKSLGPGGLDALQELSGQSSDHSAIKTPFIFPRPILKLTMPPLQKTPALTKTFKGNSHSAHTLSKFELTENLIDLNFDHSDFNNLENIKSSSLAELRSGGAKNEALVNLKQQEEQKISILDQAEKERQELQNEINLRRDARRKSLANRRVSFAPEATLHTWDLVVEYQDSTTSTNSTSSKNKIQSRPSKTSDSQNTLANSSPRSSAEIDFHGNTEAPTSSKDIKMKRRRSSTSSPSKSKSPDDDIFSSPLSENTIDDNSNPNLDEASNSDNDPGEDGTSTSLDSGDYTNISFIQPKFDESIGSSIKPSNDFRQAAYQADNAGTDFDEDFETNKSEIKISSFTPSLGKDTAYGLKSQGHIEETDTSLRRYVTSSSNSEKFQDKEDNSASRLTNERKNRDQTVNDEALMNVSRAGDKAVETGSSNPRYQNNSTDGRVKLESFGSSNSNISGVGKINFTAALGCKNEGEESHDGKENTESRNRQISRSFMSPLRHSTRIMTKQNKSIQSKYRGKLNINTEDENINTTTPLDITIKTADQEMDDTMEVTNAYGG